MYQVQGSCVRLRGEVIDEIDDTIDYKNNKAYLCMADLEYSKKFYNKNKHYKVRLYAKNDAKSLYDEYEVKDWFLSEKGLELDLA